MPPHHLKKKKKKIVGESSSSSPSSNQVDRISELPESLIHQILSRLDTADVLRTSFVSTTFQSICQTTPNIRFDLTYWRSLVSKKYHDEDITFLNCVDRVVKSKTESICKFELSAGYDNLFCYSLPIISSWMKKVLESRVEKLVVRFPLMAPPSGDETLVFPENLFVSTITVLEIWLAELTTCRVVLPSIPAASNIHDLCLKGVKLPSGNASGELVLNCGVLKILEICHCDVQHLKVLKIDTPSLEKLWVCLFTWKKDSGKVGVKICTPNLVSLTLVSIQKYYLHEATYLIEVDLLFLVDAEVFLVAEEPYFLEDCSMKILPRLYNAQNLKLTCSSEQVLIELREIQKKIPYGFHNLRHITVVDGSLAPCSRAILNFLECCPLLETIVWKTTLLGVSSPFLGEEAEDLMPNHEIFPFLRTAEFKNIRGTDFEVDRIASILEKALRLRRVTIQYDSMLMYDGIKRRNWQKKIVALPISSPDWTMCFLEPDPVIHPSKAHSLV